MLQLVVVKLECFTLNLANRAVPDSNFQSLIPDFKYTYIRLFEDLRLIQQS